MAADRARQEPRDSERALVRPTADLSRNGRRMRLDLM